MIVSNPHIGDVDISVKGVKHALSTYPSTLKAILVTALPDLIKTAIPHKTENDKKNRKSIQSIVKMHSTAIVAGKTHNIAIVVRDTNMGKKLYHYEVLK